MVGKLSHSQRIEALLFKMCSVFIRLVFSTDYNKAVPAKPPKAESKPAAFLQSMEQLPHTHTRIFMFLNRVAKKQNISKTFQKFLKLSGINFWKLLENLGIFPIASPASGGNGVLHWRADSFPVFTRGLEYKNNSLYVQQDGYYYIFSKIAHLENCNFFKHQVMQCTERYSSQAIELMQSSRYSTWRDNSYLGGIFQLYKGDSVFVKVNNSSQVHGEAYENFFGAFMV
uniref:THD domain-containing protein n=1 Tax=Sinocyclocheilus anshuiensis TaxID=1608454 RepID=A0A671RDG6_9TELE